MTRIGQLIVFGLAAWAVAAWSLMRLKNVMKMSEGELLRNWRVGGGTLQERLDRASPPAVKYALVAGRYFCWVTVVAVSGLPAWYVLRGLFLGDAATSAMWLTVLIVIALPFSVVMVSGILLPLRLEQRACELRDWDDARHLPE